MIAVRRLNFRYPNARTDALAGVDWQVEPGEVALVAGQSGSGKSTLLRCLNGLIPHFHGGFFSGDVSIFGRKTLQTPPRDLATTIGTVFQDPETQLVTDSPEDEVIFTLENLGFDGSRILRRLDTIFRDLGIEHLRSRRISTLSGGERQMVALAAALAAQPRAVLLDEPTSQLDAENARAVIDALTGRHAAGDLAVILAEHRLTRLLPTADTVVHVRNGRLTRFEGSAATAALVDDGLLPPTRDPNGSRKALTTGAPLLSLRSLNYAYGERQVLRGIDLDIHDGETLALTGPNGSGKTTLLKQIIGLLRPDRGEVILDGRPTRNAPIQELARSVGYVPQHPTIMLHQETVAEELRFTLAGLRRDGDVERTLASVGLDGYGERHPLDLSGGERQRLAIAAIVVGGPRLLLLDEPTRGLPWSAKHELAALLRAIAARGTAVIVASHDADFCRVFADRRIGLEAGRIASDARSPDTGLLRTVEDQDVTPLLTGSNLD